MLFLRLQQVGECTLHEHATNDAGADCIVSVMKEKAASVGEKIRAVSSLWIHLPFADSHGFL